MKTSNSLCSVFLVVVWFIKKFFMVQVTRLYNLLRKRLWPHDPFDWEYLSPGTVDYQIHLQLFLVTFSETCALFCRQFLFLTRKSSRYGIVVHMLLLMVHNPNGSHFTTVSSFDKDVSTRRALFLFSFSSPLLNNSLFVYLRTTWRYWHKMKQRCNSSWTSFKNSRLGAEST